MNISTKSTTKQKRVLKLAIVALTLTLQLTSCQSSKIKSEAPQFPEPYDTEGNLIVTYDVNTDKVSMPLWYWKKIVRYAVDVQGVEEE
jgi:NADH:ubiquinone oxidoreductase subunit 4 (subunit M)